MKFSDLPTILQIADDAFGKSYISREMLINRKVFVRVATDYAGSIIGFSSGIVNDTKLLHTILHSFPQAIRKALTDFRVIGITKSLAVRNDMRNCGIGTLLFADRMEVFKSKGVEVVLMPGWQKPDGSISINTIARRFGFQQLGVVNNYYYEESLRRGFYCPVCGAPPCQCSAAIYWKKR